MSEVSKKIVKLTGQQQRVIKLLFKFRFVSALGLAQVMGISRPGVYQVLEVLVSKGLVDKVYAEDYRIDRKPAYYYLNKAGVTTVSKLMEVKESAVQALYKNNEATDEYITHCLTVTACYVSILHSLHEGTDIFTKAEINRFKQFPKNRPDLYIRTPNGHEAVVVVIDDKPSYIIRKRLDEIISHSEDEGWPNNTYPHICFVLKDTSTKDSLLYATHKRLESMGMDEDELHILAASLKQLSSDSERIWSNAFYPTKQIALFE